VSLLEEIFPVLSLIPTTNSPGMLEMSSHLTDSSSCSLIFNKVVEEEEEVFVLLEENKR
jgi:hypothetical protein